MGHGGRGMARARRRVAAAQHGDRDADGELDLRRAATRAARAGAAELAARGVRTAATRVAIALPPGLDFAQALHACLLLGRRRGARRPAPRRGRARADRGRGARVAVEEPLGERGPARASVRRARRRAHDLDASALVDPHLRHDLGAAAGRADATATCCGARSARPSRSGVDPRRALAVRAAALARRRPLDPAALGDLRDDRGRPRALRDRPRARTRCGASGSRS